jgi:hypothetical protein
MAGLSSALNDLVNDPFTLDCWTVVPLQRRIIGMLAATTTGKTPTDMCAGQKRDQGWGKQAMTKKDLVLSLVVR